MDVALRVAARRLSLSYSSLRQPVMERFSLLLSPSLSRSLTAGIRLAIIGSWLKVGIDHLDGPFIPPSPAVSRSPYVKSPPRAPFCRFSLDLAGATFDKHGGWFAVIGAD